MYEKCYIVREFQLILVPFEIHLVGYGSAYGAGKSSLTYYSSNNKHATDHILQDIGALVIPDRLRETYRHMMSVASRKSISFS